VLLSVAVPAVAQESKDKATDLARIEVTGSNIRRTDVETASPVQVISKQDIQNMGARTLLQVLDNLPAARPAQQDARSLFTGSDGASRRPTCAAWVHRARWCC
jgi:outer membrane cobalamin receptor